MKFLIIFLPVRFKKVERKEFDMVREFKDEKATVRVFGTVNQDVVKKATQNFMKGVENEKKIKKKTA